MVLEDIDMSSSLKVAQSIVLDDLGRYKWNIVKNKPIIPTNCAGANTKLDEIQEEIDELADAGDNIPTKNITHDLFYKGTEDRVISSEAVRKGFNDLVPLPGTSINKIGTVRVSYESNVLKLYSGVDGMSTTGTVPTATATKDGGIKTQNMGNVLYINTM